MTTSAIANVAVIKRTTRTNLMNLHKFDKTVTAVGIVGIQDESLRNFVVAGLSAIDVGAIVVGARDIPQYRNIGGIDKLNENELLGFDFFIFDNEAGGIDVVKLMQHGIVPIMPEANVFSGILKPFNPMKFEGNGFFWKRTEPYRVFERVVAYLENIRFPEDKRILIKNVMETF